MSTLPEMIISRKGRRFLFKVEESSMPADYQKYENLRQAIWQFAEDHLAGTRNLMCENFLHEGSSLFIGVFEESDTGQFLLDEAHLVGFSYGFVGIKDKTLGFDRAENLWFYSQFLGVRPDRLNYGLGIPIKEFQREVLLKVLHLKTVVCTYDPLTAVNAYRNVRHFGMEVLEYRVAPYGEYGGRLNRQDVPSDRFFMAWELEKETQSLVPVEKIPEVVNQKSRALSLSYRQVKTEKGQAVLEIPGQPDLSLSEEFILIPVPADFYLMLNLTDISDPEIRRIPVHWRLRTREVFQHYFRQGYRVVDFLKLETAPPGCFYLLRKSP